jgi:hypothetical protein
MVSMVYNFVNGKQGLVAPLPRVIEPSRLETSLGLSGFSVRFPFSYLGLCSPFKEKPKITQSFTGESSQSGRTEFNSKPA